MTRHWKDGVGVAFNFLDYVPNLKIPEVYTIIFWPTYDVLPICDWECCKDAVLAVCVSRVGFQKLAGSIVPQPLHIQILSKYKQYSKQLWSRMNRIRDNLYRRSRAHTRIAKMQYMNKSQNEYNVFKTAYKNWLPKQSTRKVYQTSSWPVKI